MPMDGDTKKDVGEVVVEELDPVIPSQNHQNSHLVRRDHNFYWSGGGRILLSWWVSSLCTMFAFSFFMVGKVAIHYHLSTQLYHHSFERMMLGYSLPSPMLSEMLLDSQ